MGKYYKMGIIHVSTMLSVQELVIYATSKCNLKCKHCYVPHGKEQSLTSNDLLWIAEHFTTKKTIIMGGEPFLYENLEQILNMFPNVTISTNGLLIPNKMKMLKEHGDNVTIQLSIEGGKKETNTIRGYKTDIDVWKEINESADYLKENNIKFYFRCSYHLDNLKRIAKEVLPLSEKYDVGIMFLPRVDQPPLNVSDQINFFRLILQYKNCAVAQPHFFQFIGERGRCKAGDERLNIFYDKRITPCNLDLEYTLGHVGQKEEIIKENIDMFLENFKVAPFECSGCKHDTVCKGSCYVAKSYLGCPLKKNINLQNIIVHDNLDAEKTMEETNLLTKYAKDLGIC